MPVPTLPAPHRYPDNTPYYSLCEVAGLLDAPFGCAVSDIVDIRDRGLSPLEHYKSVRVTVTDENGGTLQSHFDYWIHPLVLVLASTVAPSVFPDWMGTQAAKYAFGYKLIDTAPADTAVSEDTGVPVYRTPTDALTVSSFLRWYGFDEDTIHRVRSRFGKLLRAEYLSRHGNKPPEYALTLDNGKMVLRPYYTKKDTDLFLTVATKMRLNR